MATQRQHVFVDLGMHIICAGTERSILVFSFGEGPSEWSSVVVRKMVSVFTNTTRRKKQGQMKHEAEVWRLRFRGHAKRRSVKINKQKYWQHATVPLSLTRKQEISEQHAQSMHHCHSNGWSHENTICTGISECIPSHQGLEVFVTNHHDLTIHIALSFSLFSLLSWDQYTARQHWPFGFFYNQPVLVWMCFLTKRIMAELVSNPYRRTLGNQYILEEESYIKNVTSE